MQTSLCMAIVIAVFGMFSQGFKKKLSFFDKRLFLQSFSSVAEFKNWRSVPEFSDLDTSQWELLENLVGKLHDWNSKVNLISRKDIDQVIPNHILPALSISLVRRFKKGEKIIDVGTGGGMPGLPLAIVCPEAHFTLVDSNSKKMGVVEDIANALRLSNVSIRTTRSEDITEKFDFIVGRAVAAIPKFLGFTSHLLLEKSEAQLMAGLDNQPIGSGLLYLKGGDFSAELQEAMIVRHKLFPVQSLLPLSSDKNVLYIPAEEIIAFRNRQNRKSN